MICTFPCKQFFVVTLLISGLYSCTSPTIIATQSIRKGDELNNQNKYEASIPFYEDYLAQSKQLGVYRNVAMEAEVCRKIAYANTTQGRYTLALTYLYKALKMDSTNSATKLEVVEDYRQIGLVQAYSGNYKESLLTLDKSLKLNEGMERSAKTMKQNSVADTYLALAQVHLTLGNYLKSFQNARKAETINSRIEGGKTGLMESLLIIGIVQRDRGFLAEAEKYIEQSKVLAEQLKLNTSRHWQALGEIYLLEGDFEKALRVKSLAVEQAVASGILPGVIISYMRLGDVYRQLGDDERADRQYKKALEIQNQITQGDTVASRNVGPMVIDSDLLTSLNFHVKAGSDIGAGLVSLRLAESHLANNRIDSAGFFLTKGLEYFQNAENKEGQAKATIGLARVSIIRDKQSEAFAQAKFAYSLTIQPDLKWQAYYEMANAKNNENEFLVARSLYEEAVAIIEGMRANLSVQELKTSFANTKVMVYERLLLLLIKYKDSWPDMSASEAIVKAFQYSEQARSRTFLDLLGNKQIEARIQSDTIWLNEEHMIRLKMNRLVQEINRSPSQSVLRVQLLEELVEVQREHGEILEKIKLRNSAYNMVISVQPPGLTDIQKVIDPGSVLIEYWVGEKDLVIWVVKKSELHVRLVEIDRATLHRLVNYTRNSIAFRLDDYEKTLSAMYDYLIKPIEKQIIGASDIILIPHRSLHFLPFQALLTSDKKYLIEKYVISYAPSAGIFHYSINRDSESGSKLLSLALGNKVIGNFSPLPGTEEEVIQLNRLYENTEVLPLNSFQESYFKENASAYNYIHLASHGVFNKQQPLYSYILMDASDQDDGRLTVNEIFGINLKSKIVTLSACETALGELEEADDFVGFSRAFIYAGTPSIVVSLWKVDDATTAWLMTRFNQYLYAGYKTNEAITYAQRDIILKKFDTSTIRGLKEVAIDKQLINELFQEFGKDKLLPYYWAPFILLGSNN